MREDDTLTNATGEATQTETGQPEIAPASKLIHDSRDFVPELQRHRTKVRLAPALVLASVPLT